MWKSVLGCGERWGVWKNVGEVWGKCVRGWESVGELFWGVGKCWGRCGGGGKTCGEVWGQAW